MRKLKTFTIMLAALLPSAGYVLAERPAPDEAQLNQKWDALSARDKASALRFHQTFRQMPAEERKFINDRIERFMQMPADERRKLKENNERWKKMPPTERQQAREQYEQRRKEFEAKWRQEHPGEEPPPFPFHKSKRNLAAPTNNSSESAVPKNNKQPQKESRP
ncbi:MAG: DUF3106 domain-containing protein [Verrucomicrobia bacterium]|nr:DUF3106 domain-containing protein [Verrucomicrobiota bacterium]